MRFSVLGPLAVVDDLGATVAVGGSKRRELLLRLLIDANRVVPTAVLIDNVWRGEPPPGADATLQSHVSHLRKPLGTARLVGDAGGYRLVAERRELVAAVFEDLLGEGRRLLESGQTAAAEPVLAEALTQWHGQALSEVADADWAEHEAARLEDLRLLATELLLDAQLALGRNGEVSSRAEMMVALHPLRERLWAQLMTALYRDGRQADTLRAYGRLRSRLVEDLGIEPSAELRQLERHILAQDPTIDAHLRASVSVSAGARPSGTVTFLFTDIENSTRLWEKYPEAMRSAVTRHDEIVRASIEERGGFVFSTAGDGVAAAFDRSAEAVTAAVIAQRVLQAEPWFEGAELRVRMAVHTGEAEERDGDYFGPPVNRTARLMAAAHGGQIVLSDTTSNLLEQLRGASLVDLGWHRLKGLADPMRVFGVRADGLVWIDRQLATDQTVPGNLPRPVTEYFGRIDALQRRALELANRRLVTLTGPGGVGKTREAVEAAWLSLDEFPGGVWFVELGPIVDPGVVIAAVAASLSVTPQPGLSMVASIVEWLLGRRLLLILDNCEHVLDPIVELVSAVVVGCPTVTVLATSREPLGAIGERVVPIPSLAPADAEALFRDRAVAADESVEFSDTDNDAVRRICQRLDGIPLAIELAAARVRSHTMSDLAARLDDRFRLLRGSGRGGLERHQTLRAAVAWSYQLLGDAEKALFDRVSVFAGGFDLDAAESVCADQEVDAGDVDDILGSLVNKSMLLADRSGASVRFSLLETLRQFGEERLAERGDTACVRDRHFAHYLDVARDAYRLQLSPRQLEGEAVFDREWDNMRAAQAWAMANDAFDAADELLRHTVVYALHRTNHEYIARVERLLATDTDRATRSSRTYEAGAAFAIWTGDFNRAVELCQRGIARNSAAHDVTECWATMAAAYVQLGEIDNARAALEHAEAMQTTDARVHFFNLVIRVLVDSMRESADITETVKRVWDFSHQLGAPWMINWANYLRGLSCFRDGDRQGALAAYRAAHAGALATRNAYDEALAASGIISALLTAPDAQPTPECSKLLHRLRDARNWATLWIAVEAVAYCFANAGKTEAAARIVGYLEAHGSHWPQVMQHREQTLEAVRRQSQADDWIAQGAAADRDDIITNLFDELPSPTR